MLFGLLLGGSWSFDVEDSPELLSGFPILRSGSDGGGAGEPAGVGSGSGGSVDAGIRDMQSVPENLTTDTDSATGRMADRGLG